MHNTVRMKVAHAIEDLVEYVAHTSLLESVGMLDEAVQLAILCKLHHVVAKGCLSFYS